MIADRTKMQLGIVTVVCTIALLVCSLGLFLRDTNDNQYWPLIVGLILAYWLIGSSFSLESLARSNWEKAGLFPAVSVTLLAVSFVTKLSLANGDQQVAYVLVDFVFNLMGGGLIIYTISVSLLRLKYKRNP
jgi:O-antigen/teichoic acid export membrane protein